MYKLLIITTKMNHSNKKIMEQIDFLREFDIQCEVLIDPTLAQLEINLLNNKYDCVYPHAKECFQYKNGKYYPLGYDIIKLLDYRDTFYIGSDFTTQLLLNNKYMGTLKSGMEIPHILVTKCSLYSNLEVFEKRIANDIMYPVIIKPNNLYASKGISNDSVVNSFEELLKQIKTLCESYEDVDEILIEKFIDKATEYTVSVLGNGKNTITSIAKYNYSPNLKYNLNTENDKLKSVENRSYYLSEEDNENRYNQLTMHAKQLYEYFKMKDYARFDFIYSDKPYLMEPNSSPHIGRTFAFEWILKYGLKEKHILGLVLSSVHYRKIISGYDDPLPEELINIYPNEIISVFKDIIPITINKISVEAEVHQFLKSLVTILKPKLILDTGSYKGASVLSLVEGIESNKFGKIVTIEVDEKLAEQARNKLKPYNVDVHVGKSLEYMPSEKIDLLLLDSTGVINKQEFYHFKNYLHKDSIILWYDRASRDDNLTVCDSIEELRKEELVERITLPIPKGLTISKLLI